MHSVSVVIPLYNKAEYVGRAIKSVLAQSFQPSEIIVVDDGSTDGGVEAVRGYRDGRLRIVQQTNSGPGAARNRGVAISRCPYIAFLDADDEWLDGFLEASIENLQACPDCVLSVTGHYIGRDKQLWPGLRKLQISRGEWRLQPHTDPRLMGAALAMVHSAGAVLCRREVFARFGGFYEKACIYGEDLYLWLKVILNCIIFRDPTPLFWQHTESSELSLDGRAIHRSQPLMPFLTCPGPIRKSCPPHLKDLLEQYLAYEALCSAHECSTEGNMSAAKYLVKHYPLMKSLGWQYTKLSCKLAFPAAVPLLQRSKRALRSVSSVSLMADHA